jgi:NADPH:quinone reductase-like Zn-dependent oxidoreductase
MKAVVFERFGDPAEVLQVREVPKPEPGPGQVRVRMLASPIGPADFLTVRGEYGRRPKLPATPRTEGVGIVEAGRDELMAKGVLSTDIGPVFSLDEIKAAVRQASEPGRRGKILLRMTSASGAGVWQ